MDIFIDDQDRTRFLAKLGSLLNHSQCLCYAWCLMPNHFHLVLRPLDVSLDIIMRRLNGSYARQFNKRHERRGYLFQDRYKSLATQDAAYLRELIRYVHLNPLRAGLVHSLQELRKYTWSGHRELLGLEDHPWMAAKEALSRFSPRPERARDVYLAFLSEGVDHGGRFESIWDEIRTIAMEPGGDSRFGDGRIVGEPEFVRKAIARKEAKELALEKIRESRPDLPAILDYCLKKHKLADPIDLIKGRKNGRSEAREEFCYLAYKRYGYSLSQIGALLDMHPSAVYHRATAGRLGK
jgi:REP element-mobilizing transposase RayT